MNMKDGPGTQKEPRLQMLTPPPQTPSPHPPIPTPPATGTMTRLSEPNLQNVNFKGRFDGGGGGGGGGESYWGEVSASRAFFAVQISLAQGEREPHLRGPAH